MFVFLIDRQNTEEQFAMRRRQFTLPRHGRIWLEVEQYVWDYLELTAQTLSLSLQERIESIIDQHLKKGCKLETGVREIYFELFQCNLRLTRSVFQFVNDNGESWKWPRTRFPTFEKYQPSRSSADKARELLAINKSARIGHKGLFVHCLDYHQEFFESIAAIQLDKKSCITKPQIVSE